MMAGRFGLLFFLVVCFCVLTWSSCSWFDGFLAIGFHLIGLGYFSNPVLCFAIGALGLFYLSDRYTRLSDVIECALLSGFFSVFYCGLGLRGLFSVWSPDWDALLCWGGFLETGRRGGRCDPLGLIAVPLSGLVMLLATDVFGVFLLSVFFRCGCCL